MYRYIDLVARDGALNVAAFNQIAIHNIVAETNLALCVRARRSCPRHVTYRDARAWYAEQAAHLDYNLLSADERTKIADEQRTILSRLVQVVRDAQVEAAAQLAAER